MATLLVGFDSAWTRTDSGAPVGVPRLDNGEFHELCPPRIVDFPQAQAPRSSGLLLKVRDSHGFAPASTDRVQALRERVA